MDESGDFKVRIQNHVKLIAVIGSWKHAPTGGFAPDVVEFAVALRDDDTVVRLKNRAKDGGAARNRPAFDRLEFDRRDLRPGFV